jgi:glycosyltransferase involved in cell wall biosynthesis
MDTTNVLTLLATRGMNIPVVVAERTDPRSRSLGRGLSWLRRVCYPQADAVIALSPEAADWLSVFVRRNRIRVIPNPAPRSIDIHDEKMGHVSFIDAASCRPTVVAVGRLSREKGFDLLLRAFAQAARGRFEWRLIILGEGAELGALTKLAKTLHIEKQVSFMGVVKDVFRVFKTADLFVMSSRYEGFPNALLEAMSCGLPVVSFNCPTGPSQIIRHGMDGILVPPEDVSALADAMEMLMTDDVKRKRLGARAVDVVKRFGLEHVMDMWESVLKSAEKRIGAVSCGVEITESTHKEGHMTGSSRFDD